MSEAKRILLVDMDRCTGCKACVASCSLIKEGLFDLARSRIQIFKDEARGLAIPILCEQCIEAPCIDVCPVNAISRDGGTYAVHVDSSICTGCGLCVKTCPYKGVRVDDKRKIAIICDLCGGDPICARVCIPPKAIMYVNSTPELFAKKIEYAKKRIAALSSIVEV
jgi:Fe-S-cluster-containing hydrogenase component 2